MSSTGSTAAGAAINALSASCTASQAAHPVFSDDDYNDFYVLIQPLSQSQMSGTAQIAPEPMTMDLLAAGLSDSPERRSAAAALNEVSTLAGKAAPPPDRTLKDRGRGAIAVCGLNRTVRLSWVHRIGAALDTENR